MLRWKIPPPRFVVFYNGVDCLPEKSEQKLSEAYGEGEDNPMLELKVQILNINEGNNEVLKQHCRTLKEYMQYVDCVRKNAEGLSVQEAVIRAVDECIRNGVLAEFLQKNKAEVIPMSIFEYDEEKALKAIRADEFELGMEAGIKKGIEQGMEQGIELGVARSIGMVIKFCAELGISKRDTAAKIEETFGLKEADVQKYIKEYWK